MSHVDWEVWMRLRRSRCDGPGMTRVRRGRGFGYLDESGERVTDPDLLTRARDGGRDGVLNLLDH